MINETLQVLMVLLHSVHQGWDGAHKAQHCLHGRQCLCVFHGNWSHHQSWKGIPGVVFPALRGFLSLHLHKDVALYLHPEIRW